MIADQTLVDESQGALTMGERTPAASTVTFPDAGFILNRDTSQPRMEVRFHTRQGRIMFVIEGSEAERKYIVRLLTKLAELLDLPENWNSYGAKSVNREVVEAVAEFLPGILSPRMPYPGIVPTVKGGVQLEWHRNGVDLELEFRSQDKLSGYWFNSETGKEWEGDISRGGLGTLADVFAQIAKN